MVIADIDFRARYLQSIQAGAAGSLLGNKEPPLAPDSTELVLAKIALLLFDVAPVPRHCSQPIGLPKGVGDHVQLCYKARPYNHLPFSGILDYLQHLLQLRIHLTNREHLAT